MINLEKVRKEQWLTLESVASELDITRQTLSRIEKWETELLASQILILSNLYKTPIRHFFSDDIIDSDFTQYVDRIIEKYWSECNNLEFKETMNFQTHLER